MDRSELHALVDSLPEDALELAARALLHFQTFPPPPPFGSEERREMFRNQMRAKPGIIPVFIAGGGFPRNAGYVHSSQIRRERGTPVIETSHLFQGSEILSTERFRLSGDRKTIEYCHEVRKPQGGELHRTEITFGR
jgi:hypothetical protein